MRCTDLAGTWRSLRCWFEEREVLVLPRLTGIGPTVCLDGDMGLDRPASRTELALAVSRLCRIVEGFALPVVYVGQVRTEPDGAPASVTIRAVAGGVVHELTLAASWYAAQDIDIDRSLSPAVIES
jgi:hypothetical protein